MNKLDTRSTGYANAGYAHCFDKLGEPIHLPRSDGWIIRRSIPGTRHYDAMGCYPLFSCHDWSALGTDLEQLDAQLVSVSIVTDPFGNFDTEYLQRIFPDIVLPFKKHFVIDLSQPFDTFVSGHHRRNARKASEILEIEICDKPIRLLDDWVRLYACLTERHAIRGIRAFPKSSFSAQLCVPGIKAFQATYQGETVGIVLWYTNQGIGNYHLAAYSEEGYNFGASFALFAAAIRYFSEAGIKWLNLQAEAGVGNDSAGGLKRFKAGWSTDVKQAYFCGRILDHDAYRKIAATVEAEDTAYFPAYRSGEFR